MFWLQISVDKDEIPLLGGQYVLGYYSTNMQSIIGLSANFQVSAPLSHHGFALLSLSSLLSFPHLEEDCVIFLRHFSLYSLTFTVRIMSEIEEG